MKSLLKNILISSAAVGLLIAPISAFASVASFSYTGSATTWTVPANVYSITISSTAASGLQGSSDGGGGTIGAAGLGGNIVGTLAVTPGTVFHLFVGGQSGANGGGAPGQSGTSCGSGVHGNGGVGATPNPLGGHGGCPTGSGNIGGTGGGVAGAGGGGDDYPGGQGGDMTWFSASSSFVYGQASLLAAAGGAGSGAICGGGSSGAGANSGQHNGGNGNSTGSGCYSNAQSAGGGSTAASVAGSSYTSVSTSEGVNSGLGSLSITYTASAPSSRRKIISIP